MEEGIRINRILSEAGICSRRQADQMIREGRITVDNTPALMGMKVLPGQEVCLDGKPVKKEEEKILLAVWKPRGVVCTTDRRWGDVLLEDIVKYGKRIYPVGRLDKESEGLILMTNQGDLLNKILKSENYHEKEYLVTTDQPVTDRMIQTMAEGVWLEDLQRRTRPCRIERTGSHSFRIILTQGLNRQIRRMCLSQGLTVKSLKRIRIMNIRLEGLKCGEFREVTAGERKQLEKMLAHSQNNTEKQFEKQFGKDRKR